MVTFTDTDSPHLTVVVSWHLAEHLQGFKKVSVEQQRQRGIGKQHRSGKGVFLVLAVTRTVAPRPAPLPPSWQNFIDAFCGASASAEVGLIPSPRVQGAGRGGWVLAGLNHCFSTRGYFVPHFVQIHWLSRRGRMLLEPGGWMPGILIKFTMGRTASLPYVQPQNISAAKV